MTSYKNIVAAAVIKIVAMKIPATGARMLTLLAHFLRSFPVSGPELFHHPQSPVGAFSPISCGDPTSVTAIAAAADLSKDLLTAVLTMRQCRFFCRL